jgi:hypothetical protein
MSGSRRVPKGAWKSSREPKRNFGPDASADRRRFLSLSRRRCLWCRAQRSHLPAVNLAGSKHQFGALDLPITL